MNKIMIIGYLGRDPESRYLPSGNAVTEFSVATSEKWRDKQSGEQKEHTEWFTVVCFGRQAEVCAEYLRKGSRVFVEGRQRTDSWVDEASGQKRYRTKLALDKFEFLSDSREGGGGGRPKQEIAGSETEQEQKPAETTMSDEDFDDDIPF
jgi:single-strand DNA-binding protein